MAAELASLLKDAHLWDPYRGWMFRPEHGHWRDDPKGGRVRKAIHEHVKRGRDEDTIRGGVRTSLVFTEIEPLLLNSSPYLLNGNPENIGLEDGSILNLRDGSVRNGSPADRIDRWLPMATVSGATPALWMRVLHRAFPTEAEKDWFRRWCGYCLTAYTREHVFLFLQGPQATGKSLILLIVSKILGSYHQSVPDDVFTAHHPPHRQWLARLDGARAVTIPELPTGAWRTATLKSLVAGDVQVANRMRMDSFEFTPIAKLMIGGNRKPSIPAGESGFARRLVLVPMDRTIPESGRDRELDEKLWLERRDIAGWMVRGAREYLEGGLGPIPKRWREAGTDYVASEDVFRGWFDECLELDKAAFTPNRRLTESAEKFLERKVRIVQLKEWFTAQGAPVRFMKRRVQPDEAPVNGALGVQVCSSVPGVPGISH